MASAWTLRAQGHLDAAQRALETLLAVSEPDDPGRLDLLARLAELGIAQDDEATARRWLEAWRAAADASGRARDPARVLELEARLARQRGHYDEAARMFEQVLRLRRDTGATGTPLAAALDGLADVERMNGRYEAAEILSREAVATVRATPDADATERTRYEGRWGQIRFDLGDEAGALAAFEAALAFAESALGPHHPTLAIVHQYLANTHLTRGAYAEADQAYERAQAILDAFPDRGYLDERATLAHNRADLLARLGGLARARDQYALALRLWHAVKGEDHPHQAWALHALGKLDSEEGREAEAHAWFTRALALRRRRQPDSTVLAESLAALARSDARLGRCEPALALAHEALDMSARATAGRDTLDRLADRAEVEAACGRLAGARRNFERALAQAERRLGGNHPHVQDLRAGLARVRLAQGDAGAALRLALTAASAQARLARRILAYLPEGDGLTFVARQRRTRDLAFDALRRARATSAETAGTLALLIEGRALVEEATAQRARRQRAAGGTQPVEVLQQLERLRARYAAAAWSSLADASGEQGRRLAALEAELERRERETARLFGAPPDGTSRATVAALTQALPRDAALVSFVRTDAAYLALVLRPGRAVAQGDLGDAAALDRAVSTWRAALDPRGRTRSRREREEHERGARDAGAELARALWRPLERHVRGARRVLLVPDGSLALIPFAALPLRRGYLVEHGPTLHLLASERDLLRPPARSTRVSLVALGNAAFDLAPDATGATATRAAGETLRGSEERCVRERFPEIPWTGREIQEIAARFARHWPGERSVLLERERASEGELRRHAPEARILHVAAHGFFIGEICPGLRHPLLRSGLALAGANITAPPNSDDDGLLTALEIVGLDLDGCEWAVLSACGGALEQVQHGEGVLGLRRSLTVAGARSVFLSLLRVDDASARAFMVELYAARFDRGLPTDEALREASLRRLRALREQGAAPPYDWAAFVASGDWR